MTIVYLFLAWAGGIVFGRYAPLDVPWLLWMAVGGLAGFVSLLFPSDYKLPLQRDPSLFPLLCVATFSFGAMAVTYATQPPDAGDLAFYNDQGWVTVHGVIVDMPDQRDTHVNLRVEAKTVEFTAGDPTRMTGTVLVQAPLEQDYGYGDEVIVRGPLRTPPEFEGFSYRDYLARVGVYSIIQFADVTITGERGANPLLAALFDFRQMAYSHIQRLLPDPAASLLAGILLGIESGISDSTRQAFNAVGATHVIAISGSNMVILAGVVSRISERFFKEKVTGILTVGVIFVYAVFVGADAAVMRAAVMVALAVTGTLLRRRTFGLASLAFAGFFMSMLNPLVLWDVGFQLSFLATLGLILYVDPLEGLFTRLMVHLFDAEKASLALSVISESLIVTIAAQITTTPIMAYHFGRASLLSLPVNLLIVPAQTPLMVLGGLGVLTSFVFFPLGQLITWGSYVFLAWTIAVVNVFAASPLASFEFEIGVVETVIIYALLFGGTAMVQHKLSLTGFLKEFVPKAAIGGAVIATVLVLMVGCSLPDGRLHVHFLAVGEGNATLIKTPSGRHVLIDTGGRTRDISTGLGTTLPFWDRRIDVLILPQVTDDNANTVLEVADRYRIGAVMMQETASPEALTVRQALLDVPQVTPQTGTRITVDDGVTITIMDARPAPSEDDDPPPLIVMVTYGEARFLITGEMTAEQETALLGHPALDVTVYQVAQGGHSRVNNTEFLDAVNPQVAILPIDAGNRFGLPHEETLSRLATGDLDLYRTDQGGAVHLWTDGSRLWVER